MAKELPFFKFEPNQWENGNIQMLSREDKGLFIDLCSMYWSRLGDLPKKLAIQKLCAGNATALNSLCEDKIITVIDDNIYIKFLSEQLNEFEDTSKTNQKNALLGWEKRRKKKEESERNATALNSQCESDAIREDKIREENIKKNNTATPDKFSFFNSLINQGATKELANDWLKVRKNKKLTNSKPALESFINEVEKSGRDINEVLKQCVIRSWGGFKSSWAFEEETPKNTTGRTTQKLMKYDD